jgi:type I restriction enzyme, S subunit
MLPEGWRRSTLGDIACISSGGTPDRAKPEYWGGDVPWVTTGEIQFNTITRTTEKISAMGLQNSSAKLFPPGTLLMAMYGQGRTRGQVAKLGIEAATNQACAAILLNEDIDPDFYFQYLSSQYNELRELGNAGTQKNLSGGILKGVAVPVPPYKEQRHIAQVLTTWDQAIATTERLLANSLSRRDTMVEKLTSPKQNAAATSWRTFQLGELGSTYAGLSAKSANDFGDGERYVPYMRVFAARNVDMRNLPKVRIAPGEAQNKVLNGDILFTISSETPQEVGMSSVVVEAVDDLYLNSFCFGYRLRSHDILIPAYAAFLLRSRPVRSQFVQLAQGSTRFNISKVAAMGVTVTVPPSDEQRRRAGILQQADRVVALETAQLAMLQEEKFALMSQLLTGKRRVHPSGNESPTP